MSDKLKKLSESEKVQHLNNIKDLTGIDGATVKYLETYIGLNCNSSGCETDKLYEFRLELPEVHKTYLPLIQNFASNIADKISSSDTYDALLNGYKFSEQTDMYSPQIYVCLE